MPSKVTATCTHWPTGTTTVLVTEGGVGVRWVLTNPRSWPLLLKARAKYSLLVVLAARRDSTFARPLARLLARLVQAAMVKPAPMDSTLPVGGTVTPLPSAVAISSPEKKRPSTQRVPVPSNVPRFPLPDESRTVVPLPSSKRQWATSP